MEMYNMFKVGDIVRCIDASGLGHPTHRYPIIGGIYEVERVRGDFIQPKTFHEDYNSFLASRFELVIRLEGPESPIKAIEYFMTLAEDDEADAAFFLRQWAEGCYAPEPSMKFKLSTWLMIYMIISMVFVMAKTGMKLYR
jgi:hypothetical protein